MNGFLCVLKPPGMTSSDVVVRVRRKLEMCIRDRAPGRGAYICKSKECLTKAVRQKQLDRALETKIDEAVLSQLMEEVDET